MSLRLLCCLAALSTGCLDGTEVEDKTYPCRRAEDCVEGFDCDTGRWICVPAGTATPDGGARDGGAADGN